MTYQRPLDKKATKAARQRQADGEKVLQFFFQLPYELIRARRVGLSMHHSLDGPVLDCAPWRHKPGCPRPRSAAVKARHLRRKRQRVARRCNR